MLDDNRRKSVTAIGDPHNPASLLASSLPGYLVILTTPEKQKAVMAEFHAPPDQPPNRCCST
jgi:hypothetical protein